MCFLSPSKTTVTFDSQNTITGTIVVKNADQTALIAQKEYVAATLNTHVQASASVNSGAKVT